jgi:hypothetical protein
MRRAAPLASLLLLARAQEEPVMFGAFDNYGDYYDYYNIAESNQEYYDSYGLAGDSNPPVIKENSDEASIEMNYADNDAPALLATEAPTQRITQRPTQRPTQRLTQRPTGRPTPLAGRPTPLTARPTSLTVIAPSPAPASDPAPAPAPAPTPEIASIPADSDTYAYDSLYDYYNAAGGFVPESPPKEIVSGRLEGGEMSILSSKTCTSF